MRRVLIEWGKVRVYSYPAMLYLGIVIGVWGGVAAAGAHGGLDAGRTLGAMLILVVPALCGARALYVLTHWARYRGSIGRVCDRSDGGAAMYGGLIGAFICSFPVLAAFSLPAGVFWDAALVTLLIGMIVTRIGCLLNGCCAGRPTDGLLAVYLPNVRGEWRRRYPTQLFEAGLGVVLLVGSLWLWGAMPFGGALFLVNVAIYACLRMGLEWTRESSEAHGGGRVYQALSAGLAVLSMGAVLVIASCGGAPGWPAGGVVVADQASAIGGWRMLAMPGAVLLIVSLFGFVGCTPFLAAADVSYPTHPDGTPDYPTLVSTEVDPATSVPVTVSYWRLQETSEANPAKDEKGMNAGSYQHPNDPGETPKERQVDLSPPGSAVVADRLKLSQAGLLDFEPAATNHSVELFGGHISVPFSPTLNIDTFSVDLLAFPMWNQAINGGANKGRYFAAVEFGGSAPKKTGFGIYAGPEDFATPNTGLYHWQVWMGDGTKFQRVILGAVVLANKANYLALTYDGASKQVHLFVYYSGIDLGDVKKTPGVPFNYAKNTTSVPFLIGMGRSLSTNSQDSRYPFHGRIQDVAFYKFALSEERIISHIPAALNL
jgi:phosphatidylglycerol:prolipoprotein diacylglycerol transferase